MAAVVCCVYLLCASFQSYDCVCFASAAQSGKWLELYVVGDMTFEKCKTECTSHHEATAMQFKDTTKTCACLVLNDVTFADGRCRC